MRLLNTKTITLEDFFGKEIPPYAILSHTWGDGEVLLEDIRNGLGSSKTALAKIHGACLKALERKFSYIWIDTCCIDKSSSAELSEAINSMFKWYKASGVCLVYLEDVGAKKDDSKGTIQHEFADFSSSRWFSRGWTLQELIAPATVRFYAAGWEELGTRRSLAQQIQARTRIPLDILHGADPSLCSVAERMSWAAGRATTRVEDEAYCLLGLFGVDIPLLYGEGRKAFQRLQKQILSEIEDYTLLTWTRGYTYWAHRQPLRSCLATYPSNFAALAVHRTTTMLGSSSANSIPAGRFVRCLARQTRREDHFNFEDEDESPDISMQSYASLVTPHQLVPGMGFGGSPSVTSRGLRLELPIRHCDHSHLSTLAWLYCEYEGMLVCISLKRQVNQPGIVYARGSTRTVYLVDKSLAAEFELQPIFLDYYSETAEKTGYDTFCWNQVPTLHVHASSLKEAHFNLIRSEPTRPESNIVLRNGRSHQEYTVCCRRSTIFWNISVFEISYGRNYTWVTVSCGRFEGKPWCNVECWSGHKAAMESTDSILTQLNKSKPWVDLEPDALIQVGLDISRDRDVEALPLWPLNLCAVSIDEEAQVTDYSIRVLFGDSSMCEPWARLLLDSEGSS